MEAKTMSKRIKVKGHYRLVTRDSMGKFVTIKKWQALKKKEKMKNGKA